MAGEEKCFTFTWKLENASFCLEKKMRRIESPKFVIDSIDESKWYIGLYPRGEEDGNYIGLYIFRDANCNGGDKVSVKYELAFIGEDDTVLTSEGSERDFTKNEGFGFPDFQNRKDVFFAEKSKFLPQNSLTVRCRIWKTIGNMTEDVQCVARTRIGVEKRSFVWNVKNFSTLQSGKNYSYEMKSLDREKQLMSVNLCLNEGLASGDIIRFELNRQDQAVKFSTLVLSLVDISGNRIECNRDEFWFDDEPKSKELKFMFTKNDLMALKSSYLPDDVLSLHWEWVFSKGIVLNEIEDVHCANTRSENKSSDDQNLNNQKIMPLSYPLNDNLKSLYDEKFLCDVELKTSARTFNAHKVVLSASSSVFKAMFSNNMKEKDNSCVNIEDVSGDTIRQMLAYIYIARIEDLTWERAHLLYAAADKYAIFSLKTICSSYLMHNISPVNACEVLLLSELHADSDFKSSVQNYMLLHLKEIVNSDGWKLLMETNSKLAADTLSLPYKLNSKVYTSILYVRSAGLIWSLKTIFFSSTM